MNGCSRDCWPQIASQNQRYRSQQNSCNISNDYELRLFETLTTNERTITMIPYQFAFMIADLGGDKAAMCPLLLYYTFDSN